MDEGARAGGTARVVRALAGVLEPSRARVLEQALGGDLPDELRDGLRQAAEPLLSNLGLRPRGLLGEELALHDLPLVALDRVADRASQAGAVDQPLEEVVLGALLERAQRQIFIVQPREHDDRHRGRSLVRPDNGLQAARVGQREIEEDDVGLLRAERLERLRQVIYLCHLGAHPPILRQQLAQEARITWVVLDEEDADRHLFQSPVFHSPLFQSGAHDGGSLAMVNQNSSIDFTTVKNLSKSTGLVM